MNLCPSNPSTSKDITGLWNYSIKTYHTYLLTCLIRSLGIVWEELRTLLLLSAAPAAQPCQVGSWESDFPRENKDVPDYQTSCRANILSFYVHKLPTENWPLKCCLLAPEGLDVRQIELSIWDCLVPASIFQEQVKLSPAHLEQEASPPLLKSQVTMELEWECPRGRWCKMTMQEISSVVPLCACREHSKKDHRNPGKTGKVWRPQEKTQILKNIWVSKVSWLSIMDALIVSLSLLSLTKDQTSTHGSHFSLGLLTSIWAVMLRCLFPVLPQLCPAMILAHGLTLQLDLGPVSPPQRCPMIWTLGWIQLSPAALLPAWGDVLPYLSCWWAPARPGPQGSSGPGSTLAKS